MSDNSKTDNDWTIIIVILAVLIFIGIATNGPSPYGDQHCYDADPTAFRDIVCE
jgi:hypothetical protein